MKFDPYRKWLGISLKDLPANHYRLLGLEIIESDLDVIEGAAERQMSFIRQYQSGEHAAEAAKLLNELAIARLCLLKPATKAAYDLKLKNELEPVDDELQFELPPARARSASSLRKRPSAKQSGDWRQLIIAGGVGVVVCLALVMFLFSGSRQKPENLVERDRQVSPPSPNTVPSPNPTSIAPASTAVIPVPSTLLWSEPTHSALPSGPPVDLLKTVKIPEHVVFGEWQQTSTALIGSWHSNIYFPTTLPDDYQLKYTIRRVDGADTIIFGFVMAGRPGLVVIDGWNAQFSGLSVDGREPSSNCTTVRGRLLSDQAAKVVMTVHPGHLHVMLDGKTIIDWHGNPQRLQLQFSMANREAAYISISQAKYVIESAQMIPLKPEAPVKRIARLEGEVDIIPLIDIDRDAYRGIWGLSKGALSSPDSHGLIYIPTVVPEEYTLSMTAELPANHQGGYSLGVGLVTENDYVQFHSTERGSGLDIVNSHRFNDGKTRTENQLFKPGIPVQLRCTVTKDNVVVDVDGKTLVDSHGNFHQFEMAGDWAMPDGRRLFFGAAPHFKFRDIKLGPPIPRAKLPAIPPNGKSIDLLSLIDPSRDALVGTWQREDKSIRVLGDVTRSKLVVPFVPPTDYKLTMKVAREPGGGSNDQALFVNLPTVGEKAVVVFDSSGKTFSGCSIDGTNLDVPPLNWRGVAIDEGAAQELTCIVRGTGIKVLKGEQTILEWTGNPLRFEIDSHIQTPGNRIGLISWNSRFRIEKLELETLPSLTFPPVAPLGNDGDLLSIVDTDRDSRWGTWKLDGGRLTNLNTQSARLQIPVSVPDQYTLTMEVERREGNDGMVIGLPMGGHPCTFAIDHFGGRVSGITSLDGKHVHEAANLSRRHHDSKVLPTGRRVKIECRVTANTIATKVNDADFIRWHGDPRRLTIFSFLAPPELTKADQAQLWLRIWDSGYVFHSFHLQPMTRDEAKELESEFDGVFPTTVQPNFVVAGGNASSSNIAGFDQMGPWKVNGAERSIRGEESEGTFAIWPAVMSAGRTYLSH